MKKLDIIGLTETHLGKEDQLSIPGFSPPYTLKRGISQNRSKSSGGIAVFVKDYLAHSKAVCRISTDSKNAIWLKLKKEHFNEPEDIYIDTFYLSPDSYEKKTKSNYIVDLEREMF